MTKKKNLLEFVREQVDEDELAQAWSNVNKWRSPFSMAAPQLYRQVCDLVDDYAMDNADADVSNIDIETLISEL